MEEPNLSSPTEKREAMKYKYLEADQEVSLRLINKVLGEKYTDFNETVKSGAVLIQFYNKLYGTDLPISDKDNAYVYIDNHNVFMKATGTQYNAQDVANGKASISLPYSIIKHIEHEHPYVLKEIVDGSEQLRLSQFLTPDYSDSAAALCSIILGASGREITTEAIYKMCYVVGIKDCKWASVFADYFKHQDITNLMNSLQAGGSATAGATNAVSAAAPAGEEKAEKKEKSEEEEVIGGFMMDSSSSDESDESD